MAGKIKLAKPKQKQKWTTAAVEDDRGAKAPSSPTRMEGILHTTTLESRPREKCLTKVSIYFDCFISLFLLILLVKQIVSQCIISCGFVNIRYLNVNRKIKFLVRLQKVDLLRCL